MKGRRKVKVFVQNMYAGLLQETDDGYSFQYDTAYLKQENALPASLTLPLQVEAYTSNVLFPFFDGLIPEGWMLHVVSRNWKMDENDRLGILAVACRNCIGDVAIVSEEETYEMS